MDIRQDRPKRLSCLLFSCIVVALVLMCGCSEFQIRSSFQEANEFFSQGNYEASLRTYEQIKERYPSAGDRVLFEMGIIYAYPKNNQKDFQRSLECFQEVIEGYPESRYRYDSERMMFHITNTALKDNKIAEQQTQIDTLRHEVKSKEQEVITLRSNIKALEQKVSFMEKLPPDKILIEKKARRLSLMSNGVILKTYKIALGGNPDGPKERRGDNKTPEGTYIIDSRNRDSRYHMSLHISYPNEQDRKHARKLGVSPGGDIMIHGIKNGYSSVGDLHTEFDWTKGCIAVTDEEIDEIEKLVPNGTLVEIRP